MRGDACRCGDGGSWCCLRGCSCRSVASAETARRRRTDDQRRQRMCRRRPASRRRRRAVDHPRQARGRRACSAREVRSAADENMGRIVDVIVDRGGAVRAAIIDFGGFLGVGSRKIAVDWNALHFPHPARPAARITLDLTRDQVKAAPEYQDGKPVVVLGALGKLEPLPSNSKHAGDVSCPRNPLRRFDDRPDTAARRSTAREPASLVAATSRTAASRRCAVARAACAGSTGSSSSSPMCRPASGRSSRSISPRRNGRRSISAWSCRRRASSR